MSTRSGPFVLLFHFFFIVFDESYRQIGNVLSQLQLMSGPHLSGVSHPVGGKEYNIGNRNISSKA